MNLLIKNVADGANVFRATLGTAGFGAAWSTSNVTGIWFANGRLIAAVAETSAATVIEACTVLGLPTSTTHCITSAIMGAGATTRLSAVSWGVTRRILVAWILTIPASAAISAGTWMALSRAGL